MTDPDVSLETHDDCAVDRSHHGDLHYWQQPREPPRVDVFSKPWPQVRQAVQEQTAKHHQQVIRSQELRE